MPGRTPAVITTPRQTRGVTEVATRPVEVLSHEETDKILEAARNSTSRTALRDLVMIELGLMTGLRPGELVALTVWHIAPFGEIIDQLDVTKSIAKGAKPRKIALHPDLKPDLKAFLRWKEQNSQDVRLTAPLFISRKSTNHLTVRAFQMILKDLAVTALGKSVNPHRLRHTFATRILETSHNIRVVQQAIGHASLQNTMRYTHPTSEDQRKAVNDLKL